MLENYETMIEDLWQKVLAQGKASFIKQGTCVLFHHIGYDGSTAWVSAVSVPEALRMFLEDSGWWYVRVKGAQGVWNIRAWERYSHQALAEESIKMHEFRHPAMQFEAVQK